MLFDSCCFVKCALIAQAVTRSLLKIYTLMNDSGQANAANEWGLVSVSLCFFFLSLLYIGLHGAIQVTA